MGKITDIKPQEKNKKRLSVFIDNKFAFGTDELTFLKFRLKIGDELDSQNIRQIIFDSEVTTAFEKAVKLISTRMRTEFEIRKYLEGKGFAQKADDDLDMTNSENFDVIKAVVEKLKEYRYVDDGEFCRMYIDWHRKDWGMKKIRYELKGLGVEGDLIEQAINNAEPQDEDAFILAQKYKREKRGKFDIFKLKNYLYTKGFDSDCISYAASKITEDDENE